MKIEPTNIIDGKPVKEFVDLPHGAFQKLVRKLVDPLWGISGDCRSFKVTVAVQKTREENDIETVTVSAPDEETAETLAIEEVEADLKAACAYFEWDFIECTATRIKPADGEEAPQ